MTPSPHPAEAQEREALSAWQISERMPNHHRQRTSLDNINDVLDVLREASHAPAPAAASGEAVAEQALIEASNAGYAQGLADGKALAKANPAAGAEPRLTPFDAVEQALRLASMMGASIGMSDVEGAEGYRQQLRAHLVEYIYPPATSERDAEDAFSEVFAELAKATRKFPTWPTDPLHALAVLGEEYGELTKDMLQMVYEPHKTSRENVRTEALQTAAMALRLFASLDEYQYKPGEQHAQREQSEKRSGEEGK